MRVHVYGSNKTATRHLVVADCDTGVRTMKVSAIDLNLLVVFDAIAQTGGVRRAADQLGITRAAMSHALARLRAQAGDPILVRAGHDWVLTDAARALIPRIHCIVEEARAVFAPQAFDTDKLQREFRILAGDLEISLLGAAVSRDAAREAPQARLWFLQPPSDVGSALGAGDDLAIGVFPDLDPLFRTERLFADRLVCVARSGVLSGRSRLALNRYLAMEHVQISPFGRPGEFIDDELNAQGLTRRIVRSVPQLLAAFDLVASSDCILTVSARMAAVHAPRFGLDVIDPPLPLPDFEVRQVWHPRVDSDPAHRWLRRSILQAANALPSLSDLTTPNTASSSQHPLVHGIDVGHRRAISDTRNATQVIREATE
jgi:DNA-binding transcriptional LysR family regulator